MVQVLLPARLLQEAAACAQARGYAVSGAMVAGYSAAGVQVRHFCTAGCWASAAGAGAGIRCQSDRAGLLACR